MRNLIPPSPERRIRELEDQFDDFLAAVQSEISAEQARAILARFRLVADRRGWLAPNPTPNLVPQN